jgi:hypothetical protein
VRTLPPLSAGLVRAAGAVALLLTAPSRAADEPAPAALAPAAQTRPLAPAPAALAPAAQTRPPAPAPAALAPRALDRVVARFSAPETGGVASPRFIFERELAFEARLEALADTGFTPSEATPYLDRHVRSALERHMAETLLESLEITPEPSPADVQTRMRSARLALVEQVGGELALRNLMGAEGLAPNELGPLLARRARASLYLDRMVATMLTPSDTELRIVHRTTRTPFSAQPYEVVAPLLARWYVAQRLNAAVRAFYEGARSRIKVSLASLPALPGPAPVSAASPAVAPVAPAAPATDTPAASTPVPDTRIAEPRAPAAADTAAPAAPPGETPAPAAPAPGGAPP